jgi:glutamine amidotransferase
MCRHVAYVGPPVTLSSLILDPEHSLYEQSWAPADMRGGGSVNADGFGVGWYTEGQVVRYRRNVPIWTDENLPGLMQTIRSGAVLAAVRNGTDRMPHTEASVAPFVDGKWLLSHNGKVPGWPESLVKLAEELPLVELMRLEAPLDSTTVFALIRNRMLTQEPAEAVASVVRDVETAAPGSRLNLLMTDGERVIATAWTHSLYVKHTGDSTTVSSEPFGGDGEWSAVPDRSLLVATATSVHISPMEGSA